MKMSKSIKDYREAMDSIKISDSFYKRTEALLSELPEIKLEKKEAFPAKRITALLSAAAACAMIAFGFKFAMDRRIANDELISELTESSEITVTCEVTVTETAPPIMDAITEEDEAAPDMEEKIETSADNTMVSKETTSASQHASPTAETQSTAAAGGSDGGKASVGGQTAVSAESAAPAETVPLFSEISYDYVTVEITPYFNMGSIKSGENPIKLKGTDCKDIIEFIAGISESSEKAENKSFTSLFSLQIADENIGLTFYSIYITDESTVVITRHDASGQVRSTYGINSSDYEALKHILFLQFGTEDDYELFNNLVSGK